MITTAGYGSWKSPISAELVASEGIRLSGVRVAGGDTYWIEARPQEGGRNVIVHADAQGVLQDLTPPPFNARTRVHEYGGGAYTLIENGLVFSNLPDQRLYRIEADSGPDPLTPEGPWRYADACYDPWRERLICVREDHSLTGQEPVNTLVSLDLNGGDPGQVLISGNDFYASPRLSPDGFRLAWLAWDHPNMPWDAAELWVAELDAQGRPGMIEHVAGGTNESVFQPEWSWSGSLYFLSDRTNWWNFYRRRGRHIEEVLLAEADFGRPQWVFGMSTYAFLARDEIICTYTQGGRWHLGLLDTLTLELHPIETSYTQITDLRADSGRAVFVGASPRASDRIVTLDRRTNQWGSLRNSGKEKLDQGYLSAPEAIEYPTAGGETAHAFLYRPENKDYAAPAGELPPLLVFLHGGPTSATTTALRLGVQFWTSRGFAVLDVNYRGSSGYGRPYRERLHGNWGVVDVEDCLYGARYLAEIGQVDPQRLAIRGGSAGGYTTLCALIAGRVFRAGGCYFGVTDLEALAKDTHKFEARYLDRMVGPYPGQQALYKERSPIHHIKRLKTPVIFFQGLEDEVVPPSQSEGMVEALRAGGVPVAYVAFEGEGHGFRLAENIRRALEAELSFYASVLGFRLAEQIEPVVINNL